MQAIVVCLFGKEICNQLPSLFEPSLSLVMSARDYDIKHPAVKDVDAAQLENATFPQ